MAERLKALIFPHPYKKWTGASSNLGEPKNKAPIPSHPPFSLEIRPLPFIQEAGWMRPTSAVTI